MTLTCRDLAEFGLPLITSGNPEFTDFAEEIRNQLSPMQHLMQGDLSGAAVVLNQSGKIVLALTAVYRVTDAEGHRSTNQFSGSIPGAGLCDVLTGVTPIRPTTSGHIFPGSKRLITAQGIWGDNTDVARPEEKDRRRGMAGSFGWAGGGQRPAEPVSGDLLLDLAIFEEGVCVGPDEYGGFDGLMEDFAERRNLATRILTALENGASRGEIFEILRPLAAGPVAQSAPLGRRPRLHFGHGFAQTAIHQLINLDDTSLLTAFENAARPLAIQLRRP